MHFEKPQKMKKSTECGECGKTFGRKDHLDKRVKKHVKIVHEQVKRVKTSAGIGTFVRKNKMLQDGEQSRQLGEGQRL